MASDRPDLARDAGWPMLAAGFGGPAERAAHSGAIGRFRRSFTAVLTARVAMLAVTLAGLAWTMQTPGLAAARVVALLLCAGALWAIWTHVRHTNVELARFVEGLGAGDLTQSFAGGPADGGFGELGAVLDSAMRRLREERARLAQDARFSFALLDDTPTALLTIDPAGRVMLANKAARRLFGARDGVDRAAFADCGQAFAALLDPARATGERVIVPLDTGRLPQRAMVSVAGVSRLGVPLRLVAVEPIQRELAAAEIAAQGDLVRVLTHEIMNSLTPVTSLARTAATLMARVDDDAGRDVADAKQAVATLARRADALLDFVDSYRQFARVPAVAARDFDAGEWAAELGRLLAAAEWARGVAFVADVPPRLTLHGDPALLAQALINLLKNGAEAARSAARPAVTLTIGAGTIEVADSGPGIRGGAEGDIFLPFFTTKASGSGVGLSVARQIVVAHGGTIRAENGVGGGARLRIML